MAALAQSVPPIAPPVRRSSCSAADARASGDTAVAVELVDVDEEDPLIAVRITVCKQMLYGVVAGCLTTCQTKPKPEQSWSESTTRLSWRSSAAALV